MATTVISIDAAALGARLQSEVSDLVKVLGTVQTTTAAADAAQRVRDSVFAEGQAMLDALTAEQSLTYNTLKAKVDANDAEADAGLALAIQQRDAATATLAAEISYLGKLVSTLGDTADDDPTPPPVPVPAPVVPAPVV